MIVSFRKKAQIMEKNVPQRGFTMENTYLKIQELLPQKADHQTRLRLIPYEGTPEIKARHG